MQTIAIIDTAAQFYAPKYFEMFPKEPVLPEGFVHVERSIQAPRMSLFDLLSKIASIRPKNVVIVSHAAGGLLIPLTKPAGYVLGVTELEVLLKYAAGTMDEKGVVSTIDATATDKPEVLKGSLPGLKDLILEVRSLKLQRLVIRACRLGDKRDLSSLQSLKELFGAIGACAPDGFDFFGTMRPKPVFGTNAFDQFIKEKHPFVDGQAPNRLAWTMTFDYTSFEVVPESKNASAEFVARHFPKGLYPGSGPFPVHAITKGETLVFPMDPQYRGLLSRVGD